jgi:Cu-Zn family superoxide dismutase
MEGIALLKNHGYVLFHQLNSKVIMNFFLYNFKKNTSYAIHIHEFGDTSDGCISLGGHYNPYKKNHGNLNSVQRHKGDLFNNFTTNDDGIFQYIFIENNMNINDLFGRSIVIHYLTDDLGKQSINSIPYHQLSDKILIKLCTERGYTNLFTRQERINKLNKESLITGNAGKRLVCGIIARKKKEPNYSLIR